VGVVLFALARIARTMAYRVVECRVKLLPLNFSQQKDMNSYATLKTAQLGELILTANETKLTGIYFAGRKHVPAALNHWKCDPHHPVLKKAASELNEFLSGKRQDFTVPLGLDGTEFQHKIWQQLARIPFGQTITYGELARRAGRPKAVRAAGAACGQNPLAIIVPCHRVVAKTGALQGFAGGLEVKKWLLALEQ
jgi:methylated-DNA-[protein]-cysteine S-methyltransferase